MPQYTLSCTHSRGPSGCYCLCTLPYRFTVNSAADASHPLKPRLCDADERVGEEGQDGKEEGRQDQQPQARGTSEQRGFDLPYGF